MKLLDLFISFAKVGIVGYGGGPSMIPLVEAEVVDVHKWLSTTDFADILAMGYALPGPIATKMSAIVGYKVAGITGAIVATLGITLPSIVALIGLFGFLYAFRDNPRIAGLLRGVRPVVIALLLLVAVDMIPKAYVSPLTIGISVISFLILWITNLHPAILIVIFGMLGFAFL